MEIFAGMAIGIMGSFHCVGMCGPLAFAVAGNEKSPLKAVSKNAAYNSGRILTYTLIGLILGYFGFGLRIIGLQEYLSVGAGVLILLILAFKYFGNTLKNRSKVMTKVHSLIKSKFSRHIANQSYSAKFLLGMLNGILPCGLVYIALTAAIATGTALNGAMLMAGFGIGTYPAMAITGLLKNFTGFKFQRYFNRLIPYGSALIGIILILRGLSLDLGMLSPKITIKNEITHSSCCEPDGKKVDVDKKNE